LYNYWRKPISFQTNMDNTQVLEMFTKLLDRIAVLSALVRQLIRDKSDSSAALKSKEQLIEEKEALIVQLRETLVQEEADDIDMPALQQRLEQLDNELTALAEEASAATPGTTGTSSTETPTTTTTDTPVPTGTTADNGGAGTTPDAPPPAETATTADEETATLDDDDL
jgi:hypothetical protein